MENNFVHCSSTIFYRVHFYPVLLPRDSRWHAIRSLCLGPRGISSLGCHSGNRLFTQSSACSGLPEYTRRHFEQELCNKLQMVCSRHTFQRYSRPGLPRGGPVCPHGVSKGSRILLPGRERPKILWGCSQNQLMGENFLLLFSIVTGSTSIHVMDSLHNCNKTCFTPSEKDCVYTLTLHTIMCRCARLGCNSGPCFSKSSTGKERCKLPVLDGVILQTKSDGTNQSLSEWILCGLL